MDGGADISKIINVIMQNPELISEIRELISKNTENNNEDIPGEAHTDAAEAATEASAPVYAQAPEERAVTASVKESARGRGKGRRNELLCALKPYVSKERARAIDSMLSIVEVFNIIKEK